MYSVLTISIFDQTSSPNSAHLATWCLATIFEVVVAAAFLEVESHPNLDKWNSINVTIHVVRLVILLTLIGLYWLLGAIIRRRSSEPGTPEERSLLLAHENGSSGAAGNGLNQDYGSAATMANGKDPHQAEEPGWVRPQKAPRRSWWEYIRGYSVFFPYLWPSKDRRLQALFVVCFSIVLIQRGTNVLVPLQIGVLIDDLSGENGPVTMPWGAIALYIFYRLLNGGNGLLTQLRAWLWIPINQYSYRELSTASFEHVHSLSLDFHTGKKTGEVVSALGKGNSINNFLEQLTFQFIPMIVDLCVGVGYFMIEFDAYYALTVTVVTFWYIYLTVRMAQWRIDVRRDMTNADREQDAIK